MWYYWAAQLRSIMFYFSMNGSPQWAEMESHGLSLPLPLYMYSDTAKKLCKNNLKIL